MPREIPSDFAWDAPLDCPPRLLRFQILTNTPIRSLFVALLPEYAAPLFQLQLAGPAGVYSTAVAIDTLRFTTTACQAIAVGARSVLVASSIARAQQLAVKRNPRPLLCGERHCLPIEGFDLGNSPLELDVSLVAGRDLVYTTTNGTLAVEAVAQVPYVLLAALVNRASTCEHLRRQTTGDVLLVCAGTDAQITWEDVLTAGAIIDELVGTGGFEVGHDAATLALAAWQSIQSQAASTKQLSQRLETELAHALGGRNLISTGYAQDVHFAAQLDSLNCVVSNSAHQPHRFAAADQ